jgi:hypothetical protein
LDGSIALSEFSKRSGRVWSKPFDYAHIEVGLKIFISTQVVCDLYFAAVVLSLEKGPTYTYPRGDFAASWVVCETAAGTISRDF